MEVFSNRASAANEIYTGFKSPDKITHFERLVKYIQLLTHDLSENLINLLEDM